MSCGGCWWRDFYLKTQSYPPQCPECGTPCDQTWSIQDRYIPPSELIHFGKDKGVRWEYKNPGVPLRRARRSGWV